MRFRAGSSLAVPQFSLIAEVVAQDQARFAATDDRFRERQDASTDDFRNAANEAMVQIIS